MKLLVRTGPAVLVLALAACGSTRFVVVDNQARREPTTAAAAPGAGTTATTTAAAQPADPSELASIKQVVAAVFRTKSEPMKTRLSRVVDGDDLGPTVEAVLDIVKSTGAVVAVDSATVSGDSAVATVSVTVGGEPFAKDVPVELVRSDSRWKVTRAGACAVLALGSPCPDTATP